jgi:hypothetical protein
MGLASPPLIVLSLALSTTLPAIAGDDLSIIGTYVQDAACKGDGSDSKANLVRITNTEVHSRFGVCRFMNKHREGNALIAQMSCNGEAGNVLLGEVKFTVRPDNTIDVVDQDKTYRSTLYPCR